MNKQELLELAESAGLHWNHITGKWMLEDEQCNLLANPDCSFCNGNGYLEYTNPVPRPFGPGNVYEHLFEQCDECVNDILVDMESNFTEYELEDYMNFRNWLEEVNGYIEGLVGLTHNDLADQLWRDWFFSNMSPYSAAVRALENEGFAIEENKHELD